MKNFTLLLVPLFCWIVSLNSVTGQVSPITVCKDANTEYSTCKSKCVDRCPTYPVRSCTKECQSGCFCASGYSRADNGTCIPTGDCPVKCPADQIFQERCTDECNEDRIRCSQVFYSCYCKQGLKRINGKCVPEANCYNCTGENQEYNECTNICQDSCQDKNNPKFCPLFCLKGCSCKKNFKISPLTRKCIPMEQCDAVFKCPENSSFSCVCDDSCNDQIRCIRCIDGCHCNKGYKRINDKCVPEINCPKVIPSS